MSLTYYNFEVCCPNLGTTFSIPGIDGTGFIAGETFYVELSVFSGCAYAINSSYIGTGDLFYNETDYTLTPYSSCGACTGATGSCFPPVPTPTPTIYYSSDTRCGDNILKRNECDPIVIFPMGVQCIGTNPTLSTIPNGSLSLLITGGTPPYTISWSTGGNGLFLTDLAVGSYSSIVVDFYGDFTAYTTCTLTAPTPVPTETRLTNTPTVTQTVTPTSDPNYPSFCLTLTIGTPSQTVNMYFTYSGTLLNSMPQYFSNNDYYLYWSTELYPNSWVLDGPLSDGNIVNYNNTITPLSDWTFLNPNNQGAINGVLGECAAYDNLCFFYRQIKGPGNPTYEGNVELFYNGMVNGYPSWQSSDGTFILSWNIANNRWVLDFTTNPSYVDPINNSTTIPPLTGWQQPGMVPPSIAGAYIGNCTPTTTSTADVLGGGSTSTGGVSTGGGLGGSTSTNNPSSGNVPFTDAVEDGRTGSGDNTSNVNQCECIAVRTISTYPGTAFYTDCDGNPAQISVPGGSGINSRACICRRIGTIVSGGVYEEPCQSVQGSSGGATITNNCLDILGTCVQNVTGGGTRSAITTAQDTGIINDGNITLRATGGYPPYQYSIDGGLTYKSTPLFNKLGAGSYTTVIKDSSGNTFTSRVVLLAPPSPTIYQVSLQTTNVIPRSGINTTSRQFTSTIKVTPELPDGVQITFDLIHTNTFKRAPILSAATLVTNTLLKKNSLNYSANTINSSTATTQNTVSGCQQKTIYISNLTETWSSVKLVNSDTLSLNTSTTVTRNSIDKCYVGESIDDFILTNLTISGCTNCGVANITV
jgi:hypothetical protein